MIEVEAKARIPKNQIESLRVKLNNFADFKERSLRSDIYFGEPKVGYFLRIREEGDKFTMTLKQGITRKGVEENRELDWFTQKPKALKALIEKSGFPVFFKKAKKSEIFKKGAITLELNNIEGLGTFLEIESLIVSPKKIPDARRRVEAIFKKMGINKNQFEPRPYMELLL